MHASRLLGLMMSLQARGRLTAPEMAAELEVSVRTIYRDIDRLSAAGIPVVADRGRSGGFKLVDGFRTQIGGLTAAEAETLFLAELPGAAAEIGFADVAGTARQKLRAALPGNELTRRLASRFHLDARGWFRRADPVAFLPVVAEAVRSSCYLQMRYGTDQRAAVQKIGPAGLVLKAGIWYLVGHKGSKFRSYRVARILAATVTGVPYKQPATFDLAEYWTRSSSEYEAGSYRLSAQVRLSPRGRALLDMLGPYVVEAAERTAAAADAHGWVVCTIPLESEEHGISELMRLGQEVEVLSPKPLRDQIRQALRSASMRYADHGS